MELEKLGPFKIGRILGRGGMGAVYEGICGIDDSIVAIKVLADTLDEDEEIRLRFESEIETLKRLHHPNIVRLSGFGVEQGRLYYVMEFINGSSLQQELRKKRIFQWFEVAKIGLEICQALRHAHDRGIIHRDIKPANILLDQEGNIKLSDFGIARFFGSHQITDIHTIIGTLEYMSPEQALGNPINSSSDLYSLGCVLYVLLTGKPPFPARSLQELLSKHRSTPLIPIHSVRHDVPEEMGYIIVDLLQIRPEDRPRNALLLTKRLQSLIRALRGDPAEIKVLLLSPEIPKWQVAYTAGSNSAIDLGQFVEDERSPAEMSTVALSLERPEKVTPLAETVTLISVDESETDSVPKKEQGASQGSVPVSPESTVNEQVISTRFTAVTNTNRNLFEEEDRVARPIFSLPMVMASTMLMLVGFTVYYLLQPVPPEVLFARITATIQAGESEEGYSLALLRSAQNKIQTFLDIYGSHPSAEQVRFYQDELSLLEHERRLERRSTLRRLSPVERTYVNVLISSPSDPEQMIDKLRAFIAVFQTNQPQSEGSSTLRRHASNPVEICVELARRRLKKLEQDVEEINAEQIQVLRRRLDAALDIESKDPARAEEIRQGIIELYQHRRWAKELVEEAREALRPQSGPDASGRDGQNL